MSRRQRARRLTHDAHTLTTSALAPVSTSIRTASTYPSCAASISAVHPSLSDRHAYLRVQRTVQARGRAHLFCASNSTTRTAAKCELLASSSSRMVDKWPCLEACINAVFLSPSMALTNRTRAPSVETYLSRRSCAMPEWPQRAAAIKDVQPSL